MEVMKSVMECLQKRPAELEKMKSEGKKVVAHFIGDYLPTELIYAAGAAPIGLVHAGDPGAVDASSGAVWRYMCPFARSMYGYSVLKEQKYFELFNMLAYAISCQHLRRSGELYEYFTDTPVFKLGVPQAYDGQRALDYYKTGLIEFKERLEDLTGNKITDKRLRESVAVYRRLRDSLKKISELRKSPHPPITTKDFIRLNHAAHLLDPKLMVELLDSCYQELCLKKVPESKGPRILLAGPCIAMGDYKVLDLLEAARATVVIEDLAEGVLFYWENVSAEGNPLDSISDRYIMRRPNCAFRVPTMARHFDFIEKLIKDFSVHAVVWYQLRLCETYDMEGHFLPERLKKMSPTPPILKLESEYDIEDIGAMRTRIETFVEIIKERMSC